MLKINVNKEDVEIDYNEKDSIPLLAAEMVCGVLALQESLKKHGKDKYGAFAKCVTFTLFANLQMQNEKLEEPEGEVIYNDTSED